MNVTATWVVLGATSALCFGLKLLGYLVPEAWFAHPRWQRVNALVPISLLSALVVVEGFVEKSRVVIDHRAAGVVAATALLVARAPFALVVVGAAATSAFVYHWH